MLKKIKIIAVSALLTLGTVGILQMASGPQASAQLFNNSRQQACQGTQLSGAGGDCLPGEQNRVNRLIATVINILSVIVGLAAVIMIIINGFRFITSGGDSNAISGAKRGIIYALVGLALVVAAQLIVFFVLSEANSAINSPSVEP